VAPDPALTRSKVALAAARRRKGQRARPLCDVVLRGATVGCV